MSPQITSRDLGFRSEILYFCTTGWAPGPRRKTCPLPCHCCLHLPGWDPILPPGPGLGRYGTLEGLRWILGSPGRVTCPWPKCGTAHPYLPGPFVPSPGSSCCMADTLSPSLVIAPPAASMAPLLLPPTSQGCCEDRGGLGFLSPKCLGLQSLPSGGEGPWPSPQVGRYGFRYW